MTGPAPTMSGELGPVDLPPDLPRGIIDLALTLCRGLPRSLDPTIGGAGDAGSALGRLLTAPLRLDDDWPAPEPPRAVRGGWVQIEVTDEDRDLLETILADDPDRGPDELARACQQLRLPVSPYRPLPRPADTDGPGAADRPVSDHRPTIADPEAVARSVVIDLSTHWAGPLATKLLAEAGATVIKLDPRCRPDGFGSRPQLYQHLNGAKDIVDLDLRSGPDRGRFEELLTGADLVVESFSRRVMSNLGYDRTGLAAVNPRLSTLSIKAHPEAAAERAWLGFGPGVHAASGLGLTGGIARPAPLAYPDFLTGLAGFVRAVELLARPDRPGVAEVSLRATIEPLVQLAAAGATCRPLGAAVNPGAGGDARSVHG